MYKKLKPCPFCGGEVVMDELQITATRKVDYFICENCGATTHFEYADSLSEAIEAWNTRKPMDKVVEQLERLKKTNERNQNYLTAMGFRQAIEIVKAVTE